MPLNIRIGGTALGVNADDPAFLEMLRHQYVDFLAPYTPGLIDVTVHLTPLAGIDEDAELHVTNAADGSAWELSRGDFHAVYEPALRRCLVRQSSNRHSIDSVIRIIHSLELASASGFLLHAASAIRGNNAFLFCGQSGAGKTTIARLAPPDVCLLTDEISCIRKCGSPFLAFGTPFAGELAKAGENRSAPVKALYFLEQAPKNAIAPLARSEALRLILKNILFFAKDAALVRRVFDTAHEFVSAVPAFRLSFLPDAAIWELIQ